MNHEESLPVIADDQIISLAKKAEERIEAINKIKRLALKVTTIHDWVDQNGRPYLQTSGAEKIARLFGISWQIDEPIFEQEPDGHFSYTYKGKFTLGGVTIEAIGSRSSRDGFFTTRYVNQEKVSLPPSEIDRADVKKAAFTNCIGNGITRLLGIRNLTWEDLKEAQIERDKAPSVTYRTPQPQKEKEDLRKRFREKLEEYCEGDQSEMERICQEVSYFEKNGKAYRFGLDKIDTVNEKWLGHAYSRLKYMMQADGVLKEAEAKEEEDDNRADTQT